MDHDQRGSAWRSGAVLLRVDPYGYINNAGHKVGGGNSSPAVCLSVLLCSLFGSLRLFLGLDFCGMILGFLDLTAAVCC
jgi:hypothetical protein